MKKIFFLLLCISQNLLSITYVVTTDADSGVGSLRQAILDVNSNAGVLQIISFAIGTGVQTISPVTALPAITAPYVFIDGTTQPGWSSNNPVIVINGSLFTPYTVDGITISGTNYCLMSNLVINGGFNNGILITDNGIGANHNSVIGCFIGADQTGSYASANYNGIAIIGSTNVSNTDNKIGDGTLAGRNLISGNSNCGIICSTNVNNTFIQNNFIGTNQAGTVSLPNNSGIVLIGSSVPLITEQCSGTMITSNLISGNSNNGIYMQANMVNTSIVNNRIGVDISGETAVPNAIGIMSEGQASGSVNKLVINGSNVISGNSSHGIFLTVNTINSVIGGNFIGTDRTGISTTIGNGGNGILIQGSNGAPCSNNAIGGNNNPNIIAYNGENGIVIDGDSITPDILNPITGNAIFNNGGDGIALLNNSNNLQLPPTLNNVLLSLDGTELLIDVTAPSVPAATTFRLDFFINNADRTPITEGQTYTGSLNGIPSGTSIVQLFSLFSAVSASAYISCTATNLANPLWFGNNSSSFSSNMQLETFSDDIPAIMFQ